MDREVHNTVTDDDTFPRVSIIVPSLHGDNESLNRLEEAGKNSGIPSDKLEIIAAIGISPNGRARDAGALRARGDILIFMDADVSFPDPTNLGSIVKYLHEHGDVGLVGPAQQLPDSLSDRERRLAEQIDRSHVETSDEFRESDMVTHACLAIERTLFKSVGMEHPNLMSGTDPDLRNRVRQQGLNVGIVPRTRVVHPPIKSTRTLLEKRFNMGRWSRWVNNHYPEFHLSTEPSITSESEARQTSLWDRLRRNGRKIFNQMSHFHLRGLAARTAYLTGYLFEMFVDGDWVNEIPYTPDPSSNSSCWHDFVETLTDQGNVIFFKRAGWSLEKKQQIESDWNHVTS